jgi:hypothetical protein
MMIFEMSEQQKRKLSEWQAAIEKVYGKKGNYEYTFRPNGIDYTITVYSDLADFELDLTEIENF